MNNKLHLHANLLPYLMHNMMQIAFFLQYCYVYGVSAKLISPQTEIYCQIREVSNTMDESKELMW